MLYIAAQNKVASEARKASKRASDAGVSTVAANRGVLISCVW